jgi:hypothetical protein
LINLLSESVPLISVSVYYLIMEMPVRCAGCISIISNFARKLS